MTDLLITLKIRLFNFTQRVNTNILIAQISITINTLQSPIINGSTFACSSANSLTNNSIVLQANQNVVWTISSGSGTIIGADNLANVEINWSSLPGRLTATVTDLSGCLVSSTVTIDSYCNNGSYNPVYTTKLQTNGKIILGGDYTLYNGTPVNRVARVNTDLTLDTTFNIGTGADKRINASAIQADGKILIGGDLTTYNGFARKGIVRLNSDGSLDTSFTIGTGINDATYATIKAIAIQPSDGKILIGGYFTTYNGVTKINIARLNTNGTLDTTFSSSFTTSSGNSVNCIAVQNDGKIILGGDFITYGSNNSSKIVRLNSNGSIDSTFIIGTGFTSLDLSVYLYCLKIQSDGKILAGGNFGFYNSLSRKK